MNKFKTGNDGFSLIEVMVSSALIGLVVLIIALQQTQQMRQSASSQSSIQGQHTLQEIVGMVASAASTFPPIVNTGKAVIYVGCFDEKLGMRDRTGGGRGFLGIFPASSISPRRRFEASNGTSPEYCDAGKGGFEVHAYYVLDGGGEIVTNELRVTVIPLTNNTGTLNAVSGNFETVIALDLRWFSTP